MDSSDEDDFLTAAEKKDLLTEALEEMKRKVAQIKESNRNQRAEIVAVERDVEFTRKELEQLTVEKEALQLEAEGLEDQLQNLNLESQMVEQQYEEMRKKVERIETLIDPQFQKSMQVVLDNLNTIVNLLYQEGVISDQPCPESEYLPITPVPSASESLPLVAPKYLPKTPVPPASKTLPEVQPKSLPVTPMSSTTKCLPEVQPEYFPITPVPSASESLPLVAPKPFPIAPVPSASESLPLVEPKYLPKTPVPPASKTLPEVQPKSLPVTPMSSITKCLPEVQPEYLPKTPVPPASKTLPEVQPKYLPITPVPSASASLPLVQPEISSTKKMKISEIEIEEGESSIKKPKMLKEHIKETEIYEIEEGGEELVEEEREEKKLEVSDPKLGKTTELSPFLIPYVPKKKSPNDKWAINYTAFVNYYFQTNFQGKFSQQFIDDCIQQGRAYNIFPSLAKQADDTQVYTRMATLKRQMAESKRKTEEMTVMKTV
ncbi:LOW QUALITY PROTEIN: titin [Xenopus tropicalis]|uniref:LOW QUALITY PROTEIN: titin n=1 Tax=Xenopus tropicalis TaxID=8364 RepID=A0A8J1J108_XENTR|nr:LOW QUALITY PROTEIN: titin [Xenopus tropicalis]